MDEIQVKLHSGTTSIKFQEFESTGDCVVVTDSNISNKLGSFDPIVVPAGESSKCLSEYDQLLQRIAQRGAKRQTKLIAVGGGVIGDLAGFAAATYMRGIPLIQVPTTLLAMVDSSVGGKVGIDTPQGKNLIGAFYPAEQVFVDIQWLKTLPEREWRSGMAEVLKYGFIMDTSMAEELGRTPLRSPSDPRTGELIYKCIQHKKQVVEADEFETTGFRAILNFGHTVGHAIEKLTNYQTFTHGEAISIGMVIEAKIGEKLGVCPQGIGRVVSETIAVHGLPTNTEVTKEVENIIQSMRGDKKSMRGELSMSLLTDIGGCQLVHDIPEQIVREVLGEH